MGENGAGKSTLVKCIMGYYRPDDGAVLFNSREQIIDNPRAAHALGLGMVYQHFTMVPAMTVTENFVLARDELPATIDWRKETKELEAFLTACLCACRWYQQVSGQSRPVNGKNARTLKQDEPTSVLAPGEADEVLTMLRGMVTRGDLTVMMITHKFRSACLK